MTKAMLAMLAKAIKEGFVVAVVREKRLVAIKLDAEGLLYEAHAGTFKPTDKAYAVAGLTPPYTRVGFQRAIASVWHPDVRLPEGGYAALGRHALIAVHAVHEGGPQ